MDIRLLDFPVIAQRLSAFCSVRTSSRLPAASSCFKFDAPVKEVSYVRLRGLGNDTEVSQELTTALSEDVKVVPVEKVFYDAVVQCRELSLEKLPPPLIQDFPVECVRVFDKLSCDFITPAVEQLVRSSQSLVMLQSNVGLPKMTLAGIFTRLGDVESLTLPIDCFSDGFAWPHLLQYWSYCTGTPRRLQELALYCRGPHFAEMLEVELERLFMARECVETFFIFMDISWTLENRSLLRKIMHEYMLQSDKADFMLFTAPAYWGPHCRVNITIRSVS